MSKKKRHRNQPENARSPAPKSPASSSLIPSSARLSWRRYSWLALGVATLGLLAIAWDAWIGSKPPPPQVAPAVAPAASKPAASETFVGAKACSECHASEYAAWQSSQHAKAMQHATDATVLGDFDNARFTYNGIVSTFFRRDGKFFVTTDGKDGQMADFEILYTFGVDPLQQYLVGFPDGRMQALSIAWDARPKEQGGARWFHLYPNDRITYKDPLHWTAPEPELELDVRRLPHDETRAQLQRSQQHLRDDLVGIERRLRSLSWAGFEACRLGPTRSRRRCACASRPGRRARRAQQRDMDSRRRDGQCNAQQTSGYAARTWRLRTVPFAPRIVRQGHGSRRSPVRHARDRAAEREPVLRRWTAARGSLRRRIIPAEQNACARSDLLRLPRSAFGKAARARQRRLRAMPCVDEVRCSGTHAARGGVDRRAMRAMPHADARLHADRSASRPFDPHSAPGPERKARDTQCLHRVPQGSQRILGGCGHRARVRTRAQGLPDFRYDLARWSHRNQRRGDGVDRTCPRCALRQRSCARRQWPICART